jgi:transposase-like protein
MERRIAPSVQLEEEIARLLEAGITDPEKLSEIGRLGARLILQRAVETEVESFLGRARYERTSEARGSRNGHRPRRVQTADGEITIAMPQLRGTLERFVTSVIPDTRTIIRTRPLEALIIGGYVRGLSTRDIEELAKEAGLGAVSRTTVSRICSQLRARYRAFCERDLSRHELLVLFLDAIYLRTRSHGPKEGVLVAWGYTLAGERVLVGFELGQREEYEDWLQFGRGLVRRGLRAPWLVVTDGAPGLIRMVKEVWPQADRQRCTVHRLRNILAKLPKRDERLRRRVRAAYWEALDEASSPADGERRLRVLVSELEGEYPTAAACLADDLPALCTHLDYPPRLKRRLRSTNLLERSLEEVQRRVKVIGRFPGESSCLSLTWAVLDLVIAGGRGLGLTEFDRRRLDGLRVRHSATSTEPMAETA